MASSMSIFLFTISLNLVIEDKLNSFQIRTNKTRSSTTVFRFAYAIPKANMVIHIEDQRWCLTLFMLVPFLLESLRIGIGL
ncbi:hypothetical protein Hanom_Chr05g00448561 [Helianthus anomalus]